MEDNKWQPFEWIWTTHADEYVLMRLDKMDTIVIYSQVKDSTLIIEDTEVYKAVKQKMIDMGVKIINMNEKKKINND